MKEETSPIEAVKMQQSTKKVCIVEKKRNLETVCCRAFQYVMKVGMYMLPWRIPKTLKGPGSVKKLPGAIKRKKFTKPLIVTDKMLMEIHLLDGMLEALTKKGLSYVIYDGVAPNPTDRNIEEGAALYKESGCDCMIAFGGGSPMDCAKGIGARIAKKSVVCRDFLVCFDQFQQFLQFLRQQEPDRKQRLQR